MTVTPDRPTTLYEGTQFTLTCVIVLNTAVDTTVMVTSTWSNSGGVLSDGRITSSDARKTAEFNYTSTLTFMPLSQIDTNNYMCSVVVSFASQSATAMGADDITVEGVCELVFQ